ncbi:AgmX/PglI C-terminal domain-containing protein [Aliiglaciecola sp. LCG003]|uniref:AgmX/PglI C-terminal domain-containing protein n=1 Tax=Aliiglaciecola sp. LCG003 TaxID=3053655 RepID=UPI002572F834|nr:AgmX/PglI C-terminal domain-containing protein [Aliiglaciecola sp. LCG003]WJG08748.1 AgmX/PglI C-terminal domain-containing protein [Aliiglaciecola sp. LCG003]
MSSLTQPVYFRSQLPWSSSERDDKVFHRLTIGVLALTIFLALLVKWQQLPEQTREEKERVPPQLTKILEAQKVEPPKPIEPPKVIPQEKPVEVKEPPKVEPEKPKPVENKIVKPIEKPKPEVKKPTQAELAQQARAKAQKTGLLQFQDELNSMRSQTNINNLADTEMIQGAGKTNEAQRAFVGKKVAEKSGGLNTGELSTDVGARGELAGRKTTEFDAPNEGLASLAAKELVTEDAVIGSRDIESIRKGFDANKGAIYTIYRRALREDPGLQGKVTVNLEIAPDGSITQIKLVSSELNYPELEDKLLNRIRLINFGPSSVTTTTLDYSFDFLPF